MWCLDWFFRVIPARHINRQYTIRYDTIEIMESERPVSNGQKSGQKPTEPEALGAILATIGDTTWRMFVPSVGFTLIGVWADGSFGTKPWLMIAGIIVGFLGACLLVKKQIDNLKRSK